MASDKTASTATKSKAYSYTYSSSAYSKSDTSLSNDMVNISRNPSTMQDTAHAHDNQGHSTLPEKSSGFVFPTTPAGNSWLRKHSSDDDNDDSEADPLDGLIKRQMESLIVKSDFGPLYKPKHRRLQ